MDSIKVYNLNLPEPILKKLQTASINSLKDLISKSELELIKILNISYPRVKDIINTALKNAIPFQPKTVINLTTVEDIPAEENEFNSIGKIIYDTGILRERIICEVSGPPGCGKTQLAMQICSHKYFNSKNSSKPAATAYIDTENNVSAKRLIEIAKNNFFNKSENEIMEMARNVYVYQVYSVKDLEKALKNIEYMIVLKNIQLIIIDSIAAIVRREFFDKDSKTTIERSRFLANISARLKEIAYYLDVSVFITNQITVSYETSKSLNCDLTRLKINDEEEDITNENQEVIDSNDLSKLNFDDAKVIPALGYTWSHFINVRLVLQYYDDNERELIIAKSPFTPNTIYRYHITEHGLYFNDYKRVYEGEDLNLQNIKTKPFENIDD